MPVRAKLKSVKTLESLENILGQLKIKLGYLVKTCKVNIRVCNIRGNLFTEMQHDIGVF